MMPYEVQTYTLADGWINTWLYAEDDGIFRAETFATAHAANEALDEYFLDLEEEVSAGNIKAYDRSNYRVQCVPAGGAL